MEFIESRDYSRVVKKEEFGLDNIVAFVTDGASIMMELGRLAPCKFWTYMFLYFMLQLVEQDQIHFVLLVLLYHVLTIM